MQPTDRKKASGVIAIITVVVFLALTAAAIILQIRYRGFEGPLSDNLLILILINANFLLLAALIFMIGRSLWKLSVERRSRVLGAKFRTKLVAAFVGLSFIPTILLFVIGSGMYTRGIERLFSLRLENSLQDALAISQSFYDRLKSESLGFARQVGGQVAEERMVGRLEPPEIKQYLARKAAEYSIGALELFGPNRTVVARAVTDQFPSRTFLPTQQDLVGEAFDSREMASVVDLGKRGEIVRAIVPLLDPDAAGRVIGAVAASYYIPESYAHKAEGIAAGYREYRSSFRNKDLVKLSSRLGFLAVMLSLLLAAIWVAMRLASSITVPIGRLAEGTVEVARGNLEYRVEERSFDEVGMLVESFNRMTADLKHSSERLRQEMVNREVILANIDAGVVSLDRNGRITTINAAAARILGVSPDAVLQKRYDEAFGFIDLGPIRRLFRRPEEGMEAAEEEVSLTVRGRTLILRLRVSMLRDSAGVLLGSVITFDDLTELLRAKKAETWQDVARKIAHEVKNPLTPIKLSAERLRKKFHEKTPDFERVFDDLSLTIIQQVDGLKGLLDEFSEFARLPRPHPVARPLEPLVDSVIGLYASAHRDVEFAKDIPAGLPDLLLDEEQIKRVFINLFKNAVEVMGNGGRIWVRAADAGKDGLVQVEVADNGPGIPAEDASHLFEPYFSRKKKGRGLGLAIVERIVADHGGSIRVERNQPQGARFIMELPSSGT